jgi:hypothetical protein
MKHIGHFDQFSTKKIKNTLDFLLGIYFHIIFLVVK